MSDADALYTERAHLVALLSTHYPAWLSYSDTSEPDWAVCFIETAQGQLTWHISPDDLHLFNHLCIIPAAQSKWDGHSTEEKYERIRARLASKDPAPRTL
jgi:hypothetical protein